MKLTSHFSLSIPHRNAAIAIHLRRCALVSADEPPPTVPRPIQTYPEVRLDLLMLPSPSALAAGDPPRRSTAGPLPCLILP